LIQPITIREANAFVSLHHRHSKPTQGGRFALGLYHGGELVGVAIVGRPVSRRMDDKLTAEVTRCCVSESAPKGACSQLYSRCKKVWAQMGGTRVITYTLTTESGASLRGAGWKPTKATKGDNNGWNKPSRPRTNAAIYQQAKLRWEAPPLPPPQTGGRGDGR
jgi:hypothetical protein